jgi:hypothetical protein
VLRRHMGNYLQIALGKIIGTKNERELKRLSAGIAEINALEPEMQQLPDSASPLPRHPQPAMVAALNLPYAFV